MYKKRSYILTGSPGTGKSTILNKLALSYKVVSEPAREVIAEERAKNGRGLWEKDRELFLNLLLKRSIDNFMSNNEDEIIIFDRGIPDCLAYADYGKTAMAAILSASQNYLYNSKVFLLEPWEAIYKNDEERTMSFHETLVFHEKIVSVYTDLGYNLIIIPYGSIEERVNTIIREIN